MPAMMGSFTADSFEGEITSLTYFVEDGDYRMVRKISAKRSATARRRGGRKSQLIRVAREAVPAMFRGASQG